MLTVLLCAGTFIALAHRAGASSIKNSPHDLSAGSSATIKAVVETRICIFCHTPHAATKLTYDPTYPGPLWSREENVSEYQPYVSDTIKAMPGQPLGPSRLCLSCHDGTIAMGAPNAHLVTEVVDRPLSPQNVLGTDLRDDHPVSMEYYLKPDEFHDPATVRLLKPRGIPYVECTSCHNPHDNQYGKFLVMDASVQKDVLCTVCHNKKGWSGSTHKSGGIRYAGAVPQEVAHNGCMSCHTPHGAQRGVALLKLPAGATSIDANCNESCHNGLSPYALPSFKPVGGMNTHTLAAGIPDLHQKTEALPLAPGEKHVHCIDCHNPHEADFEGSPLGSSTPLVSPASVAPNINGPLKGVRGVDIGGTAIPDPGVAVYEYQVCFRCHAGTNAAQFVTTPVQRVYYSLNESDRFNPASAKSYHPVAGQLQPGEDLLPGAKTSYIYCSDCHDPHGSGKPYQLKLDNRDTFSEIQDTDYPLCYKCHDEFKLMDTLTDTGKLHKAHVFGRHDPASANPYKSYKAACSACHDPHGVPLVGGSTVDNSAHLINFDLRYAPMGSAYSQSARSCSIPGPGGLGLSCHAGGTYSYSPTYPYNPL